MRFYNCDIYKFKELIQDKKLVCFGAGQALRNFINYYVDENIEKYIYCIADNQCEHIGKNIQLNSVTIPLINVKQLIKMEDIILLISCMDICGIYEQLNSYISFENVDCFATRYIMDETNNREEKKRYYPENYRIAKEQKIPKIIHYCWFGGKKVPENNLKWMESWKKYCPDYEIIRWDETNYDVTKNTYMYEAYKAGKWGFVSDYARLDIIYEHGGIYLDTDVELLKNLDELLYQPAFSGVDGSRNISLGLGFGAQKRMPIIKELKGLYEKRSFKKEDGSYNLTPAPTLQKEFFSRKGYVNNGDFQIISEMAVYPEKVLSAKSSLTGRIMPSNHSFAIHHYDGSWNEQKVKDQFEKNSELLRKIVITI